MVKKIFFALAYSVISIVAFCQSYPFPMRELGYTYPHGYTVTTADNEKIQSRFASWNRKMYKESTDGQYGRIRFDTELYTVSEGIGYGMLIYVYMANETNNFCQDRFDKLYAYYKKWSNGNGLMNWKIEGFEKVNSYNAATDGDLDVALALCLAAKQWGYSSNFVYAEEAETMLNAIYKKEVGTHIVNGKELKVFNPGDSWNSIANPCYFTLASIGVFVQAQELFDFSTKHDWQQVYDDCHTFLEISQHNGLWPNWSNWDGSPAIRGDYDPSSPDFGWDACRTPWRVAWDYIWFGSERSKSMMSNTIEMIKSVDGLENPYVAGYYSNLTGASYENLVYEGEGGNSAYLGGFACALMCDEEQQDALDLYYDRLKRNSESPYYAPTLQILYLLVSSGNAANFFDLEGGAKQIVVDPIVSLCETDGKTLTMECSKDMKEDISDYSNFSIYLDGVLQENAIASISCNKNTLTFTLNNIEITSGTIVSISYNGENIESQQGGKLKPFIKFPVTNNMYEVGGNTMFADCESGNNTLLGGSWYSYSDGSKQSYSMVAGGANETATSVHFEFTNIASYAGVGFNILNNESPLNCSGSTSISFYHKGDACILEAKTVTKRNANYSYQTYDIPAHEDWTLITLTWEEIADDFVTSGYVTEVTGFQWKEVSGSGEFWIDEVELIGRSFSPSSTSRVELTELIITANTLYEKASTEVYVQQTITDFATAINSAADVNATPSASVDDIAEAILNLQSAIDAFKSSKDRVAITNLISSATTLVKSATTDEYPQDAIDALSNAILTAIEANSNATTREEIDNAVLALQNAIDTFNASKISSAIAQIDANITIYPNPCVNTLQILSTESIKIVKIFNQNGQTTITDCVDNTIDVSQLQNGNYIISITLESGKTITRQFSKL